ncbi:MAG: UDP-N-acetylglucosamine 2-epimerase [Ignavibacteria bacterium RBG_16_34_14]|nr:MAG: UDP-N-acetylglucosamine 2-epimerase [Ignavibacteria bacterium RBG_16_34_14]
MKKILVVFGTRPEVIKLTPVINELKRNSKFKIVLCSTGQHKEMLKQMSNIFKLKINYDLDIMTRNQNLNNLTADALKKIDLLLQKEKPDLLLVQGDTTTAFAASLAAFYHKIKIAHIEAGLRSNNIYSPFPEEVNRKIISLVADFNFAPTQLAKQNLLKEGFNSNKIWITGNTVIDAVLEIKKKLNNVFISNKIKKKIESEAKQKFISDKYILITMHRREKFGEDLKMILILLKELAEENSEYKFVYPVHLNPNVKNPVNEILQKVKNFILLPPVDYLSFLFLMQNCRFIISDSGGVQEECFVFKKPIMVLRKTTERNEAIDAGYAFLAGHSPKKIRKLFYLIDEKVSKGFNFFNKKNPFGDGKASQKIVKIIKNKLANTV